MPVVIKRSQLKYKNPDTGSYVGVDAIAEKTTAELVADIESVGQARLGAINTRAAEVTASLPRVDEMEEIVAVPFVQADPNPAGSYVIYTADGVNKLFKLPDGHAAGATWASTYKVGPITFSDELTDTVKELISVQATQPISPENKLWITDSAAQEYDIPTMEDFAALADDIDDVAEATGGKVAKPSGSPNGVAGQFLQTNGDGTTTWVTISNEALAGSGLSVVNGALSMTFEEEVQE